MFSWSPQSATQPGIRLQLAALSCRAQVNVGTPPQPLKGSQPQPCWLVQATSDASRSHDDATPEQVPDALSQRQPSWSVHDVWSNSEKQLVAMPEQPDIAVQPG